MVVCIRSAAGQVTHPDLRPKTEPEPLPRTRTGTLRALTEDFNALVEVAHARGLAPWAKHHKSLFISKPGAEKQIARLRAELEQ